MGKTRCIQANAAGFDQGALCRSRLFRAHFTREIVSKNDKLSFILEGFVEPFCFGGGIFVVAAIGLIVDFVFVARDWKRRRQRKEK